MKYFRTALFLVLLLALTGWVAHKAAPLVSDRLANNAIVSPHFRVTYPKSDYDLAMRVSVVLESEYKRVSTALGHGLRKPVNVRVATNRFLYNLSCGLPVPTPPGDGFDGAAGDRGATLLLPPDWKLGDETEIPDRGRTLAIHEVTHMMVAEMNPAVLQKRWLNEGVVWYLAMGMDTPKMRSLDNAWMGDDIQRGLVPKLSEIASADQKNWVRRKGDYYGRQFVQFVAERYGKDKLPAMVRNADNLRAVLGKDEAELYPEWVSYLKLRSSVGVGSNRGGLRSSSL